MAQTDRVCVRPGIAIGLRYILGDARNPALPATFEIIPPPGAHGRDTSGAGSKTSGFVAPGSIAFFGQPFAHEQDIVEGPWTFVITSNGQPIYRRTIIVSSCRGSDTK